MESKKYVIHVSTAEYRLRQCLALLTYAVCMLIKWAAVVAVGTGFMLLLHWLPTVITDLLLK